MEGEHKKTIRLDERINRYIFLILYIYIYILAYMYVSISSLLYGGRLEMEESAGIPEKA